MDTRLIELLAPPDRVAHLQELFTARDALDVWSHQTPDGRTAMHVVMAADKVDELMAALEPMVAAGTVGRVLLLPVQAMLPRLPDPEPEPTAAAGTPPEPVARRLFGALNISREELYAQISGSARLSGVYFLTIGLSTTVAIVGLRRSNVAIIIGAMVIAPLLGPNVALALATALGDVQLGRNAVRTALAGVTVAFANLGRCGPAPAARIRRRRRSPRARSWAWAMWSWPSPRAPPAPWRSPPACRPRSSVSWWPSRCFRRQ